MSSTTRYHAMQRLNTLLLMLLCLLPVAHADDVTFAEYARRFLTTYAHRKGLKPSSRRALSFR